MKVLIVSRFVQPHIKLSNSNVYKQAYSLHHDHGFDIEFLTWPLRDGWEGPVPDLNDGANIPPLYYEVEALKYHIINPHIEWNERVLTKHQWKSALKYGITLLEYLKPDIVHLQHWFGLWWMLEAAQQIGIPTAYSNHDWGLVCLRTVLVKGDGSLCDANITKANCSQCIWQGRGFVGKVNETVVKSFIGRMLIEYTYNSLLKDMFQKRGMIRIPLEKRLETHFNRVSKILPNLSALFVPSNFARDFFSKFGVKHNCIHVNAWYHDPKNKEKHLVHDQLFTITYIGRVSQEKGVHRIFEALNHIVDTEPIHLRITGENQSKYCLELKKKYQMNIGSHKVEWLGWTEIEPLMLSTDVVIIPSEWMDNTPLSLIEAMSYSVPVIATKIPTIEEIIDNGKNGYLAEFGSIESLKSAIIKAIFDKNKIRSNCISFPDMLTCKGYTNRIATIYKKIANTRK